jgi:hypothetical protein
MKAPCRSASSCTSGPSLGAVAALTVTPQQQHRAGVRRLPGQTTKQRAPGLQRREASGCPSDDIPSGRHPAGRQESDESVKVVGCLHAGHLHRGPKLPVAQDAPEDGPPDIQRAAQRM